MAEFSELVLTAVGPDRPGLVAEVTAHLHAAGANVADSRMVNLRGRFALLVLIEGSAESLAASTKALQAGAEKIGLTVTVSHQSPGSTATAGVPYHLRTYSADQPGIVHRISELLQRRGINIEALETHLDGEPFTGTKIFTMDVDLSVPPTVQVREFREQLGGLCAELNCDFDLEPG